MKGEMIAVRKCVRGLVLLLVCLLTVSACGGGTPPDYLAFQREDFSAEVEGRTQGRAFGAKITVEPVGSLRRVTVLYLSSAALEGVQITALCNAEGVPEGDAEITYGEMTLTQDAMSVCGLLAPALRLLSLSEVATVQREDESYRLTFSDGSTLILDANGNPRSLAAEEIELDIVWRETKR